MTDVTALSSNVFLVANACVLVRGCDISVPGKRKGTSDHLHVEQKKNSSW